MNQPIEVFTYQFTVPVPSDQTFIYLACDKQIINMT